MSPGVLQRQVLETYAFRHRAKRDEREIGEWLASMVKAGAAESWLRVRGYPLWMRGIAVRRLGLFKYALIAYGIEELDTSTTMGRGRPALACVLLGHVIPTEAGKCTRPGCKYERLVMGDIVGP